MRPIDLIFQRDKPIDQLICNVLVYPVKGKYRLTNRVSRVDPLSVQQPFEEMNGYIDMLV